MTVLALLGALSPEVVVEPTPEMVATAGTTLRSPAATLQPPPRRHHAGLPQAGIELRALLCRHFWPCLLACLLACFAPAAGGHGAVVAAETAPRISSPYVDIKSSLEGVDLFGTRKMHSVRAPAPVQ